MKVKYIYILIFMYYIYMLIYLDLYIYMYTFKDPCNNNTRSRPRWLDHQCYEFGSLQKMRCMEDLKIHLGETTSYHGKPAFPSCSGVISYL